MKIVSGTSNEPLAKVVAEILETKLTPPNIRRFKDKEMFVQIGEPVRGKDVFVIQPTSCPANDTLMELMIIMQALKLGDAKRIIAVMPYFGYARQDRKTEPRAPITAKLVADMLPVAGADHVLTVDLHSLQTQGFFPINIKSDNLEAAPVFVKDIKARNLDNPVIVSPDVGGVVRARHLKKLLELNDLAIIDKQRPKAGHSVVMNIIGNVEGRHCILVDDIADSAGTLCNGAEALKNAGATSVDAYVTHGVLSEGAVDKVSSSQLDSLVITDTIEATESVRACPKIRQVSVAPLLAEAIRRINKNESMLGLFM